MYRPTAMQVVAVAQDTPVRSLSAPLTLADGLMVHFRPLNDSVRVWVTVAGPALPTARHVVRTHETDTRMLKVVPGGFGAGTLLHTLPFQDSMRSSELLSPTAKHDFTDGHRTPKKPPCPIAGVVCVAHVAPLPLCAKVRDGGARYAYPTAVQNEVPWHDTDLSWLYSLLRATGSGSIFHELPFQSSARGCAGAVALLCQEPTSTQRVAVVQDTLNKSE
jgi:hypothetical protein